ncbi:stage II sporulation protein R [Lysinibacillus louembei]|uniref:Stage II sporulation protein R n=1 Tax=Lysinibacillus louembei TaxID=1470088 RepID=A0ABZ0RZ51_9BACI|nr:stage II sporulation protein R [Lysinibacillus louembei]WPK12526.1 stage II sporulation protein R [Lysinibacillus louembei]
MLEDYNIARKPSRVFMIFRYVCYALISYILFVAVPHFVDFGEGWHEQKEASPLLFRVVANSNLQEDQQLKQEIVQAVQPIFEQMAETQQTELIVADLQKVLEKNYAQYGVHISIGDNLIPPKYEFASFYPQNFYQSVVLTIGKARGDNWFCSAFPKTCEKPEERKEEKRKFVIYEWLKRKLS